MKGLLVNINLGRVQEETVSQYIRGGTRKKTINPRQEKRYMGQV
jgi:hypothetical protein